MKTITTLLIVLSIIVSTGYSQNVELGTKEKKVVVKEGDDKQNVRRTVVDYENFQLTKENLAWAKNQVQEEKIRAEKELKSGKITQEEYEVRMQKIGEAESRIKDFERSPENIDALSDGEEKVIDYDPKDAEMGNKKDDYERRLREREERERKKREANRSRNLEKSYTAMLANVEMQKQKLEADFKAGIISQSEYNQKMDRFNQTERQLKAKIEELQKRNDSSQNGVKHGRKETGNVEKETKNDSSKKAAEARERLEKDKAQMAKDLKEGKISQEEYDSKMARIKRVEEALKDMK